jgi:tRNA modification GTPase
MARPGEFSERAFLNDKIDLAQAEAIADLIDAQTEQAAKSATRSLQGEFSKKINVLLEKLIHLRMYVEAAIDFPEEEIDFLSDGKVSGDLTDIQKELNTVLASAKQGALLKEGMTVVIAGKPNAGKSSLLNCLSGRDSAIVTEIEGTTRDVLKEHIQLDGLPLHIVDTAGLRDSDDVVEQEGVRRAYQAINDADVILLVTDINHNEDLEKNYPELFKSLKKIIIAYNKMDLCENKIAQTIPGISVSAKTGEGLGALKQALKESVQFHDIEQSQFIARRRHIDALVKAKQAVDTGAAQLTNHQAGELLAEDLRIAQQHLSEITGEFTTDDLLGKIFSSFCIGK